MGSQAAIVFFLAGIQSPFTLLTLSRAEDREKRKVFGFAMVLTIWFWRSGRSLRRQRLARHSW